METQPPEGRSSTRVFGYIATIFLILAVVAFVAVFMFTRRSLAVTIVVKDDAKTITVPISVVTGQSGGANVTSTIYRYSETFYPTGTKTVAGVATGQLTIYNKTASAQPLVKTTRFLTKDGTLFRLRDSLTVPAGGQVTANVYADKAGKAGEIPPSDFTIPGLASDKQTVIFAKSDKPMVGGVVSSGLLSQKDLDAAKQKYDTGALANFIKDNVVSGPNQVAMIYKSTALPDHKAGDEVGSFTISGDNTVVVVTYNKDEVLAQLQKKLRGEIDLTSEKVVAAANEPKIELSKYSPVTNTAELSVKQEVSVSLDANSEKLAPVNFFGKNKSEIERYLLGLDHVDRVTVEISPSWLNTAPKDAEKIKVIIKDM